MIGCGVYLDRKATQTARRYLSRQVTKEHKIFTGLFQPSIWVTTKTIGEIQRYEYVNAKNPIKMESIYCPLILTFE